MYESNIADPMTSATQSLRFDNYSTLESLKTADFTPPQPYSVLPNELNLKASDPFSYAYFGSFYTEVANAVNNIINAFPYAILSYDNGTGTTIYDYVSIYNSITHEKSSTFKVPYSALTNQGGVVVNSATTVDSVGLASDINKFCIQLSSVTTNNANILNILGYNFSSSTIPYLEFTVNGFLDVSGTTSTIPLYIRPTKQRLAEYDQGLSELEYNMFYGFNMNVIDVMDDITEVSQEFIWPKTIDGFNPDIYGNSFESFKASILKAAASTDDAKTNILIKTVIPENYLELDSEHELYASLIQTYGHQFDEIKRYIDGIAYAHTITYSGEENTPNKFLKKLSALLGWKLSDNFTELDLFEYMAGDADGNGNSYSYFNIEIWKRILININWLYKRKGTRDAIQFIFKLIGAPDCLLRFDEFTYKINQITYSNLTASTLDLNKINQDGYINYNSSNYIFQEGGPGRGDGHAYIQQWAPEFEPVKQIDNIKVVVADDTVFGSENIINTKELSMVLDPAQAIECDVFGFYQQSGTCWAWGSFPAPIFSEMTVPFEYSIDDCSDVQPEGIENMTLAQYLDYVYSNMVDPTTRKTLWTTYYPQLRAAYLSYYMWTNPQSNRLTFHKLQPFVELVEGSFTTYSEQLVPATTILDRGLVIRNTVFNRQRFVYKVGLNLGSEFRTTNISYNAGLTPVNVSSNINGQIGATLTPVLLTPGVVTTIYASLSYASFTGNISLGITSPGIQAVTIGGTIVGSSSILYGKMLPSSIAVSAL